MFRTFLTAAAIATLAVVGATPQVRAGLHINDLITLSDGVGQHPGGIFNVDILTSGEPNFDTFCVELTEFIRFGPTYRVDNIGTVSVAAGRPLTSFAAWLYYKFRHGGLPSFDASDPLSVTTLQFGIWKAMGYNETDMETLVGNGFYSLYDSYLTYFNWQGAYNTAVANSSWSGIGPVRIANLQTLTGDPAQDVLTEVPEPVSIVVWSMIAMFLGSMGTFNRRPPLRLAV